jgi:hypothetical protein
MYISPSGIAASTVSAGVVADAAVFTGDLRQGADAMAKEYSRLTIASNILFDLFDRFDDSMR